MEAVETFEHDGVTVEIHYDEHGAEYANPREADNLATLICWHPDYVLGDEQFVNPEGRGAVETSARETWRSSNLMPTSMEHLRRYLGIVRGAVGIVPLYLLDHSGLSISAGSPSAADPGGWDTTMVGFAYTTHERVTELCGEEERYHADEWIREQVAGEVDVYDDYLRGSVYGYIVARGTEDEESCWGFLGDPHAEGGCVAEAKADAALIAKARREAREHPWLPTFGNPIAPAVSR